MSSRDLIEALDVSRLSSIEIRKVRDIQLFQVRRGRNITNSKPESKSDDWDKWFSCVTEEELHARQEQERLSKHTIAAAKR